MVQKKKMIKYYVYLHGLLMVYSLGSVCSKLASQNDFLSPKFCIFYGLVLLDMMIYAILWQQILKKLPLTVAFANKAITIIWGILWGMLIFNESITPAKILGGIIIIAGIILVVKDDND